MSRIGFTEAKAYARLLAHRDSIGKKHIKELFYGPSGNDLALAAERVRQLQVRAPFGTFDCSRQRITAETIRLFCEFAEEIGLRQFINDMFSGKKLNVTEDRAVGHTALRDLSAAPFVVDGVDYKPLILEELRKIEVLSDKINSGSHRGVTNKKLTKIVGIGIGGSKLGPESLARALTPFAQEGMELQFISNVDGADFASVASKLDAEETLFVVISKTFTTSETMQNARTAKHWLLTKLNNHPEAIKKHFFAVSTNAEEVTKFGINVSNMVGFWDWVGGRYSSSSAAGALVLSLLLGHKNLLALLQGAHEMDQHFLTAPFDQNIPVLMAISDLWNNNFLGIHDRALIPYAASLVKIPEHDKQNEMESNGKQVTRGGQVVNYDTGETVFGGCGTDDQHANFQHFHQSPRITALDFIAFLRSEYDLPPTPGNPVSHHEELFTNVIAQADALAFGQHNNDPHRNFPGNRPSSILLMETINPRTVGMLLAVLEHRTVTKGVFWDINSFDQFGVELGKKLGVEMRDRMIHFHNTGIIETGELVVVKNGKRVVYPPLNPSSASLFISFMEGKLAQ